MCVCERERCQTECAYSSKKMLKDFSFRASNEKTLFRGKPVKAEENVPNHFTTSLNPLSDIEKEVFTIFQNIAFSDQQINLSIQTYKVEVLIKASPNH